jgi:uncharacterized repeat protein (TIGR01451 family)
MRCAAVALVLAVLGVVAAAVPGSAQLSLTRSHEGTIDYVVTGATLRQQSNGAAPCDVNTSASATLSGIPAGATITAAYLYWAGSGDLDASIRFNGTNITADRTATSPFVNGTTNFSFFGAFKDVTTRVTGNGTYTISQLAVDNDVPYCGSQAVMGGWSMVVVYESASLPVKRVQVHDGLRAFRAATETVTLSGFLGATTPLARLTYLAWDGDPDLTGDEEVRFNGFALTDGLNPAGNGMNSTVNSQARTNVYGLDLDSYDVSSRLSAGARTASLEVETGNDMVVLQAVVTAVAVVLVDVTPKGLAAPVARLAGTPYSQVFAVENPSLATDNFDVLARATTGAGAFVTVDSVTGPGITTRVRQDSSRVQVASGTTRSYTVWYTVAAGATADNVVYLKARAVSRPVQAVSEGWAEVRRVRPSVTLAKTVTPSASSGPGTDLTYTLQFGNAGNFAARGVTLVDVVPTQVAFKLGSIQQTLPAGITATVAYSSDAGATWTYAPVSAGCGAPAGYDACVRRVRWTLTGDLPADAVASAGTLRLVARIR